jgi:RHS repeat-associated protein
MLCKVAFWDGTAMTFGYNGNGQLTSLTNAMGKTSVLAYDSDNRVADIRDALAGDYVAAGGVVGTAVACPSGTTGLSVTPVDTQICYDSSGRVATIIQPAPTTGAARPARTYTYASDHTGGTVWSYPDLHGNVTVTTGNTGSPLNNPVAYDPWGQPVTGSQALTNAAGGNILGAFGSNNKLTDTATGITITGARPYEAAEGRFLSVDPIEGGCANNYAYVFGDPFGKNDLTGRNVCRDYTITHIAPDHGVSEQMGLFGGGIVGGWLGFTAKLWVTWGKSWGPVRRPVSTSTRLPSATSVVVGASAIHSPTTISEPAPPAPPPRQRPIDR